MIFLPIPDSPEPKLGSKLISFLSRMKHRWAILRARATQRNRRTVMTIEHRRSLGLGGVALTGARNNKHEIKSLTAVRDRLEGILDEDGFLFGAPFSWVTISIRHGLVDASEPSHQAINKKYGDLPMSIEVETDRLVGLGLGKLCTGGLV